MSACGPDDIRLGLVAQVTPLLVTINGDTTSAPAVAVGSFTGATVGVTEVLVKTIEGRRFAWRVS